MRKSPFRAILVCACLAAPALIGQDQPAPLRVLILSGQNNHDWQTTTPRIRSMLEATRRFDVAVTERPDQLTADALAPFDVILSNWNAFGRDNDPAAVASWPAAARSAYLDFVRRGKGHVVVHAGSCSFADWPEYRQLTLAWWEMGQTQHGPPHRFPVRFETLEHPIITGLRDFDLTDELWVRPGRQPGAEVLVSAFAAAAQPQGSGNWEPLALVDRFGEGRTFTLLAGHDAGFMEQPGFQALLTRGTEWAATGRVTIRPPAALKAGARAWNWRQTGTATALRLGQQVIWQFNHGPGEAKPCFHPVALPDRPALTGFRPNDHPWHRALWFSWKFINGVNYWEEDRTTGESAGRTEQEPPVIELREDYSARIAQDLVYRPANGNPVMREHRVVEVIAPVPEMNQEFHFDWDMTFTALQDLVLDRTPLPEEPGGQVFGGYAGLSVRFAPEFGNVQALTTEEPVVFAQGRYRGRASGFAYRGRIAGRDLGIAILDHPYNLNAPSPWYAINDPVMRYFSPAVICYGPHRMKTGETLRLRYRVIVNQGRWTAETLRGAVRNFAE